MATTIDALNIEIRSTSTNAAQGINELAAALGNLKANGSFSTAINNLKKLSAELRSFADASHATRSLGRLAGAMQQIKNVGSIANVGNTIKKLSEGLQSLNAVDVGSARSQIEGVASAVAPLSSIKAGGLGTMVNALSKIGQVTKALDDKTISEFAAKIERLNDELGPLSQKMTTISSGFKAIGSGARSAGRGVAEMGEDINSADMNMANFVSILQSAYHALQGIIDRLGRLVVQAAEWDGISARFGRGFGENAEEVYAWIQRLNEEMGINVQQFMQYSSVYATMLTGFGVAMEDAGKMALGYTELTYDIWAGYNDIYKTFDDAAEAVKSAIAGEVEPVRRAGFTIVEATLEQTAANHGLKISLENATEAQKSYLRYLTLVDQAHAQGLVGTYAKELNTAEGVMRTFSQQLKSLAQAFGSLFLPALVNIMPYIQAFVELLTDAVKWIASLFGIEIQGVDWSGYNAGVGDAVQNTDQLKDSIGGASKAAKELKNATIGIDELNVISPPDKSGGGGGSKPSVGDGFSGLDIESLWDESIFDSIQSKVGGIKDSILGFFDEWETEIGIVAGALGVLGIAGLLTQLGQAVGLGDSFLTTIGKIKKIAATAIIITLQFSLQKEAFGDFIDGEGFKEYLEALIIGGISSYILYSMWGTGGLAIGLGVTAVASVSAALEDGSVDSVEEITVLLTGLASAIGAVALAWKGLKSIGVVAFITEWASAAAQLAPEVGWLAALFPKLSTAFATIGGYISTAATAVGTFVAGISAPVWVAIGAVIAGIASVAYYLYENWNHVTAAAKEFFAENIAPKLESIKESWDEVKAATLDAAKALWDAVPPGLKDLFVEIGRVIGDVVGFVVKLVGAFDPLGFVLKQVEELGGQFVMLFGGALAGAFNSLVGTIEGFVQALSGGYRIVAGFYEVLANILSGDWDGALTGLHKITEAFADLFDGLFDMTVGSAADFMIGAFDWVIAIAETMASDLEKVALDAISKAWDAVKDWWNEKPTLKSYVPSIGSIKDKVSAAWDSAKTWWDSKKSALKTYTPSIGSIFEKLSERWNNAKEWWNNKKTALKSYTPSIGSIYDKLSERWTNARTWWNSKKSGLNSYTPSIGSIKDKLSSAWNTAKSWWSSTSKNLSAKLNIKTPKITIEWAKTTVLGKEFKYPKDFDVSFAAKGGMFDMGSLVWAGERGAEIVANASGGRTGVMNVQQMQDAVYDGVYSAVVAAMRATAGGGSSEQAVNVYLDGKQLTQAVEQRQRERGVGIMGNQVYTYG